MALALGALAVGLVTEGKAGAVFSAGLALAMIAFVLLAGWMRKRAKKHADLFPPSLRSPPSAAARDVCCSAGGPRVIQ